MEENDKKDLIVGTPGPMSPERLAAAEEVFKNPHIIENVYGKWRDTTYVNPEFAASLKKHRETCAKNRKKRKKRKK